MTASHQFTRRRLLKALAALGLTPGLAAARDAGTMRTAEIPASGEPLPVIGLGTYDVFDVEGSPEELAARREILDLLFDAGGTLIDTSPMYDRSERVIGDTLATGAARGAFLATKVWTDGQAAGERQMARSAELMRTGVIDLMQVHNLRDTDVHFETIRAWQEAGRIRYNGITHYVASAHDDLERAIRKHRPQFLQVNYSLGEPEAERRLLPFARDEGVAVLANRPFVAGRLFAAVRGRELPDWAREFAASWGQFFLKFIVSHPAITAAIPATSKPEHMADNVSAGFGPLPDEATRLRMRRFVEAL